MITFVVLLLTTYLVAVADTALAPVLAVYQVAPSWLPLVAIVWMVAGAASPWRIAQMALVGLAFDFQADGHAGVGMISFALVAFLVWQARGTLRRLRPVEQAVVCAPLVSGVLLLVAVGDFVFGQTIDAPAMALARVLATGVYTAACSLPVWMVLDWLRDARLLQPAAAHL